MWCGPNHNLQHLINFHVLLLLLLLLFFLAPASTKPAGWQLLDNGKIVDCDRFLAVVFVKDVEEWQRITPLNGHW